MTLDVSRFNPADEEMEQRLRQILKELEPLWQQVPPEFQLPADCEELIQLPWAMINRISYRDPVTGKRTRLKELRRVLARLKAWCIDNKNRWAKYVVHNAEGGVTAAGTKKQQRELVRAIVGRLYIAVPPEKLREAAEKAGLRLSPQAWEGADPEKRLEIVDTYLQCREGLANGMVGAWHLCRKAYRQGAAAAPPAYYLIVERATLLRDPRALAALREALLNADIVLSQTGFFDVVFPLKPEEPRNPRLRKEYERLYAKIPLYKHKELLKTIEELMRQLMSTNT